MYIIYLRRVHNFDYYSTTEYDSPEEFVLKCPIYLRKTSVGNESKTFIEDLDSRINQRFHTPKIDSNDIERKNKETIDSIIKLEEQEKYRCKECNKLFKGKEFITKHVFTKHIDVLDNAVEDFKMIFAYSNDWGKVQTQPYRLQNVPKIDFSGKDSRKVSEYRPRDHRRGDRNVPRRGFSQRDQRYTQSRELYKPNKREYEKREPVTDFKKDIVTDFKKDFKNYEFNFKREFVQGESDKVDQRPKKVMKFDGYLYIY